MSKKPNGKKPKSHPNHTGLKQARAECREKANQRGHHWWPICWNKNDGYYCPDYDTGNKDFLCFVDKSGAFTCVEEEIIKAHNLKGCVNPAWWEFHRKMMKGK